MIRRAALSDVPELAKLRDALWPDSVAAHAAELRELLGDVPPRPYPYAVLVADLPPLIGFAEVTLRSYADGCDASRPAGYLEGWYVAEPHRRQGLGAELMRAAEDWARAQGCTEMASDTWLDNDVSQRAHETLGYEVVDRVVTYRKAL